MNPDKLKTTTTTDGRPAREGYENAPAPAPIDEKTGQHEAYWILTAEERAKGCVRPVRRTYRHVGMSGPRFPLQDLSLDERELYSKYSYEKFEVYPPDESPFTGRFWTRAQLASVGKGCGTKTTMSPPIAETYARDPSYYGSTFCVNCGQHFPVGEHGEFVWLDGTRVGGKEDLAAMEK